MKKSLIALSLVAGALSLQSCGDSQQYVQPELGARKVNIINDGQYQFKDLNKNGALDKYEDWRLPMEERIADLVSQMTLEEKAGMMLHPNIAVKEDGVIKYDLTDEEKEALRKAEEEKYAGPVGPGGQNAGAMAMGQVRREATAKSYIEEKGFRSILNNGVAAPKKFAEWSNGMQEIAENSRLGIPIMFSSDPRHSAKLGGHVSGTQYFSHVTNGEGQVGISAARNPELMKQFGEVMAEEFRAVGLHMFLGPQIDVMTEPRWSRNMGCFSEDADLTQEMSDALIEGAQGENVGPNKILVHLKHWPGSGPHANGQGSWLVYPSDNQEYHYKPWRSGIQKGALAAMGYYSGTYYDTLNVNYSYHMSTEVLKQQLGFKGAICTDWGVATRGPLNPDPKYKDNTTKDNYAMIFNAGVDQIGSETHPEYIVELVNEGRLPIERVNDAVSRILLWHFSLGLFENPYVDADKAEQILQSDKNEAIGLECQHVANVLLTNDGVLPIKEGTKVYVEGIAAEAAAKYGNVVSDPKDADVIIYRTTTAGDRRMGGGLDGSAQEVNIDFPKDKMEVLKKLKSYGKPVVADLNPTGSSNVINDELKSTPNAILLSFDPTDEAVLDVLFGKFNPIGKLPYEIPSSMEAVRNQLEDKPFDSANPAFAYGFGLSY